MLMNRIAFRFDFWVWDGWLPVSRADARRRAEYAGDGMVDFKTGFFRRNGVGSVLYRLSLEPLAFLAGSVSTSYQGCNDVLIGSPPR